MGSSAPEPLRGYTVGITAERKAEELASLLTRRGAEVVHAPAMHTVPLPQDGELAESTREVLSDRVDFVVASTGMGFRGWMEAADQAGDGEALRGHLAGAKLLARGSKATGAIHGAGLRTAWSAPSEESGEVLDHLLGHDLTGSRVVVQVHGDPMLSFRRRLAEAGAEVVPVMVYRWTDPLEPERLDDLIERTVRGEVHALAFTSAPAATNLLARAERLGRSEALRSAVLGGVVLGCVGPVTAAPVERAGLPHVVPERSRTSSLVRLLAERLPAGS
ncbi:uroporphyrinogen-III synthase [Actinopolyspora xinjiangensis]|uniref:Uroporphyrinogen-III synthase n=1 Tax=Actinopolyspora xinjiangensis TaxID=405564 RepID=A0A1H0VZV3_9ACTN|nr:uroporphyrinogen-III synthase [Actinopolyspora xinjiangensis]SDP83666.1 uroporphyrinogen-III synthase [Actinopolyspora xinjiangensis]